LVGDWGLVGDCGSGIADRGLRIAYRGASRQETNRHNIDLSISFPRARVEDAGGVCVCGGGGGGWGGTLLCGAGGPFSPTSFFVIFPRQNVI